MLPDDLTERIWACAERSLLPGAAMPGDDEGLYGRVDPAAMDGELARLGKEIRATIPQMNAPFGTRPPSSYMFSLQLLAPFWPAADRARQGQARSFDNPSIHSITESTRRRTIIQSHVPGHELRFPPRSASASRRMLAFVATGPRLGIFALGALTYGRCNPACRPCPANLTERLIDLHPVAMLMTFAFLSMMVVPGVVAVAMERLSSRAPLDPTRG